VFRTILRHTIWDRDAIPTSELKYAGPLKRVLLPIYDVAVILLGLLGLVVGFQATSAVLPEPGSTVLYMVILVAGALCLVGCAFPALWAVEITGKSGLLVTFMTLLLVMLTASVEIPGHTGLTLIPLIVMVILIPSLRLWVLGVEIAGRRDGEAS
jgi:hypothetical protein